VDALGLDIGGTKIAGARVGSSGNVISFTSRPTTPGSPDAILGAISEIVEELGIYDGVGYIGVAVAAFLNLERDTVLFSPNIDWENYPLKSALEERLETTVFLENDANAAAWGEFCFGAAQDSSSMVMLTVGTGIGGALVDDGRLIIGGFGMAGELGHIIIEPDGRECGCGNKGCLEQYASGTALMREARIKLDDPNLDRAQLIDLLVAGDSVAIASISKVARTLGRAIASFVAVTDTEKFVIGGGVAAAGDLLLSPIKEGFLESYGPKSRRPIPQVCLAMLGTSSGVVGAAELARANSLAGK